MTEAQITKPDGPPKFKVGDRVRLKCDGPVLVVTKVYEEQPDEEGRTFQHEYDLGWWHAEKGLVYEEFVQEVLILGIAP